MNVNNQLQEDVENKHIDKLNEKYGLEEIPKYLPANIGGESYIHAKIDTCIQKSYDLIILSQHEVFLFFLIRGKIEKEKFTRVTVELDDLNEVTLIDGKMEDISYDSISYLSHKTNELGEFVSSFQAYLIEVSGRCYVVINMLENNDKQIMIGSVLKN